MLEIAHRTTYNSDSMLSVHLFWSYADAVWPALVLEERLLSIIPISAGLIFEWLVLWLGGFGFSWKKAIVVDVVMNTVSTLVGIILIPVLGLLWEVFPGLVLYKFAHVGTFNPGTWFATFVMAVLATSLIEAMVVRWGFKVVLGQKRFWIICAANFVSVALAFASLWIHPPQYM